MSHPDHRPGAVGDGGPGPSADVVLPAAALQATDPREQQFSGVDQSVAVSAEPGDLFAAEPPPPDRNPYLVYRASLTNPGSRRTLMPCLDRIAALLCGRVGIEPIPGERFPWHLLRFAHTSVIRSLVLEQGWAPAYARKHIAALRKVLEFAWRLELMSAEDHQRAIRLDPIKGTRLPKGRSIAEAELEALLRVCLERGGATGLRDAAMIALLYSTGLRRFEVANARLEDYDIGDRSLLVIGKGDKQRRVYLQENAAKLVGRWLALADRVSGPLFLRTDKWNNIYDQGLSADAVGDRVTLRREQAELPHLTTHDFRRTFIGVLLDEGADLATASELAGHESTDTTKGYDRRLDRTRKAAVDRIHLPVPTLVQGDGAT
ncbi:tyrosine-type recombinase/integrase [Actinomadura sp. LOL_016]|uniref:tyrosine-type recombinase/integrase n=1 Tax=unclassified Actinomadura TaxID=2626254 RepID=UPI003A7FEF55